MIVSQTCLVRAGGGALRAQQNPALLQVCRLTHLKVAPCVKRRLEMSIRGGEKSFKGLERNYNHPCSLFQDCCLRYWIFLIGKKKINNHHKKIFD